MELEQIREKREQVDTVHRRCIMELRDVYDRNGVKTGLFKHRDELLMASRIAVADYGVEAGDARPLYGLR